MFSNLAQSSIKAMF
ncbi:hypothetical protein OJO68_03830 [Escherichia coli]|nr:hypothetical protein [Escherichia coli]EJN2314615.1 hypothetical protein [Escherichia coli]MCW3182283.1 hypothetical protein [Escherichia coli]MCW3187572.1 hypothetical protein [Escherichia coli]MDD8835178.1 hypothetical protein [Escherichia coli]HDP8013191.1 hypothetical protein [Escherichia coli]